MGPTWKRQCRARQRSGKPTSSASCAAEVILAHREQVAAAVDPEALLDLLTPPLRGEQVSYADYVAAFDDDVELFYPDEPAASG